MLTITDPLPSTLIVADEVIEERIRQDAKWGQQDHPNGTGGNAFYNQALMAKFFCEDAAKNGTLTWQHILTEEFYEALTGKIRSSSVRSWCR